ncbi:dihydroxyacetone kinase subunit L [Candidatus Pelagibacter sp.]|nr:dihydroxyacetone kinase subunit L [Candidatus Pelagibacter sp.]
MSVLSGLINMLNKQVMINVFSNLLNQSKKSYDEFNAADGKIGDGDLGITILNGLEEINNNIEKFTDDLSINFMLCSQAFVKKSGSSFGTLIAFSFMNISKNLKGKNTCDNKDIITMIDTAMSTIQERGKTKVGDKTILDTLDFILRNLKATKDNINYPKVFKLSTKEALDAFKGKKILIGRARMFEDKTKDLDDPGMLALHKLSEAF